MLNGQSNSAISGLSGVVRLASIQADSWCLIGAPNVHGLMTVKKMTGILGSCGAVECMKARRSKGIILLQTNMFSLQNS